MSFCKIEGEQGVSKIAEIDFALFLQHFCIRPLKAQVDWLTLFTDSVVVGYVMLKQVLCTNLIKT